MANEMSIEKITVTLANGNTVDYTGRVVLFAEDTLSPTEKALSGEGAVKVTSAMHADNEFLAAAVQVGLRILAESVPGLDIAVMKAHAGGRNSPANFSKKTETPRGVAEALYEILDSL